MILIIDNYDSFTYNLVQMVESIYDSVVIIKNDSHSIEAIEAMNPSGIILSPGPCTPNDAGICLDVVQHFHKKVPILGICLGHQVIAQSFGSSIVRAKNLVHGKVDLIANDGHGLFSQVQPKIYATRYHSLIVEDSKLSKDLMVTARSTSDNYIMGIRHIHYPVEGLQFHPESYKTEDGMSLISQYVEGVRTGGYYV